MLILTRRREESIIIDSNITVTILNIDNNQVRLGIDAPKSITVHREEIYKRIQAGKTHQSNIAANHNENKDA